MYHLWLQIAKNVLKFREELSVHSSCSQHFGYWCLDQRNKDERSKHKENRHDNTQIVYCYSGRIVQINIDIFSQERSCSANDDQGHLQTIS